MNVKILYFFFVLFVVQLDCAQAYIDPSTGSIFLQVLLGGLAGGLFYFNAIMKKAKTLIKKMSKK